MKTPTRYYIHFLLPGRRTDTHRNREGPFPPIFLLDGRWIERDIDGRVGHWLTFRECRSRCGGHLDGVCADASFSISSAAAASPRVRDTRVATLQGRATSHMIRMGRWEAARFIYWGGGGDEICRMRHVCMTCAWEGIGFAL